VIFKKVCRSGEWSLVVFDFGRGYAQDRNVLIRPICEGNDVTGGYMEYHYNWIFPKKAQIGSLSEEMNYKRRWIDGIYSVWIKPGLDVVVASDSKGINDLMMSLYR
jgi:hypothetical protein